MKIFADFHHDDLFHSLHLLFEKRLGHELYAPCGPEWYTKGYWAYSLEPQVIAQYLVEKKFKDTGRGFCLVENPCHERELKGLTLDQFKEMDIDIVISSVPEHATVYKKLIRDYKPKAKLIQQIGNEWQKVYFPYIKNFMISCQSWPVPKGSNAVFYHQEFDLGLYTFTPGSPKDPINSFVNDLPNLKDWGLFQRYEKALPDRKWKSYGLGCRDGNVRPLSKLVKTMQDSSFIFHAKSLGDGFGHIIHNIFALGRPALVRGDWYKGRLAEVLIQDQKTCIDLDKHEFKRNIELIKEFSKPKNYREMCKNAEQRFRDIVNYDTEEFKIRDFLRNLK